MSSRSGIHPSLAFTPTISVCPLVASFPVNPPGALVPGQRPERALNSAQFTEAQQARAAGVAVGLSRRALEVSVAQAVMRVP